MTRIWEHPFVITIPTSPWPFALTEVAAGLLAVREASGYRSEQIEVTFGSGAMEAFDRSELRQITEITAFDGIPVVFPEETWTVPQAIKVTASGEGPSASLAVLAEVVKSATVGWLTGSSEPLR